MSVPGTLPCTCGRRPRLVHVSSTYGAAWDGGTLQHWELRCPRWFFRCHTVRKNVSKSDPWWRWKEDLTDEWNEEINHANGASDE